MKIFFLLVLVAFISCVAAAQPIYVKHPELDPCLKDVAKGQVYVSQADKFSISLPAKVEEHALLTGGGTYHDSDGALTRWDLCEGSITVMHFVFRTPMTGEKYNFADYAAAVRKNIETGHSDFKFVSESKFFTHSMDGAGFMYTAPGDNKRVFYAYTTGSEEFLISVTVKKDVADAEKLLAQATDTFAPIYDLVNFVKAAAPEPGIR